MIIWQGLGFLVVVIAIAAFIVAQIALDAIFGTNFFISTPWAKAVWGIVAAIPIWLIGYKLNNRKGRLLIDPDTNQEVNLVKRHTLFWIPMQYYAPVFFALGILMTYAETTT